MDLIEDEVNWIIYGLSCIASDAPLTESQEVEVLKLRQKIQNHYHPKGGGANGTG